MKKVVVLLFSLFAIGLSLPLSKSHPPSEEEKDYIYIKKNSETSKNAMVSTTHYIATEIGLEVLKQGGNAIDASAAIQFALNVVQPQSTGIGGGCIVLIYESKTGKVHALDGREEAPNSYHGRQFCKNPDCLTNPQCDCSDGFVDPSNRRTGGHPVGVPGTLRAVQRLLNDFGTWNLSQVVEPSIKYAREGFPMYEKLYNEIVNHQNRLIKFPESVKIFLNDKDPKKPKCEIGEIFKNEDFAKTLEYISKNGIEPFYDGELAKEIVETAKNAYNPDSQKYGLLTEEDIKGYLAVYREPIHTTYRSHTIYGFPPPSAGGATLFQMLDYVEAFDLTEMKPLSLEMLHRMIDAQNAAFADRDKYLADADFADVPLEGLIDKKYLRRRRDELFKPFSAATTPISPGNPPQSEINEKYSTPPTLLDLGTTHWSIVDQYGNAVAFTSTIENNLGSAVVVKDRGFLLNNELTDFDDFEGDENGKYANAPEGGKKRRRTALGKDSQTFGGKRPKSSMTPTIVFNTTNNQVYLVSGAPGGSSITGAVFNVLLNIMDLGQDVQVATDQGRLLSKNTFASAEREIYEHKEGQVFNELLSRGFNFSSPVPTTATYGLVQTVLVGKDGNLYAAADSKRQSVAKALGF